MHMQEATEAVLAEVAKEREYQDRKWGGQPTDDKNKPADWSGYITMYLGTAMRGASAEDGTEYRKNMLKVAALAVAAVETYDRGVFGPLAVPASAALPVTEFPSY
jgi:hypothetical protein